MAAAATEQALQFKPRVDSKEPFRAFGFSHGSRCFLAKGDLAKAFFRNKIDPQQLAHGKCRGTLDRSCPGLTKS